MGGIQALSWFSCLDFFVCLMCLFVANFYWDQGAGFRTQR